MLRQFGKNKPIKVNENESDLQSSIVNRGNKQFGLTSGKNSNSSLHGDALKVKPNNQKEFNLSKNGKQKSHVFSDKPNNIPQKRTNIYVDSQDTKTSEMKKQSVEITHRRREEEAEWSPLGLDLDFSTFGDEVEEFSYNEQPELDSSNLLKDSFPSLKRQFNSVKIISQPLIETDTVEEPKANDEEFDMSTVEYGPPKEKEIPFTPYEDSTIILDGFSDFADLSAYELSQHYEDKTNVSLYEDKDALLLLQSDTIDNENLVFAYSDIEEETDLSSGGIDFSNIPYDDYELDINQFIQCN